MKTDPQPAEPVKMPSDATLLGCTGVSLQGDTPAIVGAADIRRFAECVLKHFSEPLATPVKVRIKDLHLLSLDELHTLATRDCSQYSGDDLAIAWELFDRLVEGGRITEPVKVPSDSDLLALIREHAFRQYEFDDLLAFARALLARYGQPTQPFIPPEKTDPWYEEGSTDVIEHAQRQAYVDGWNACREAILKGQKGGQ